MGVDPDIVTQFTQSVRTDNEGRPKCRGRETALNCTEGCLAINYSTTRDALTPSDFYCRTISAIAGAWKGAWGEHC